MGPHSEDVIDKGVIEPSDHGRLRFSSSGVSIVIMMTHELMP